MTFVSAEIKSIVEKIATILTERNQTIAVSEAACGGILSAYLVSVPGASKFYHGGTLVYSVKSKLKLSGWTEKEILSYTGPSEASVLKRARNLRIELGSTYVLSESGWAGPTNVIHDDEDSSEGSKSENEVGTVYFAISGPDGEKSVVKNTGDRDRVKNMERFAKLGLEFLLEVLEASEFRGIVAAAR